VVDDEPFIVEMLEAFFRRKGHRVSATTAATEALGWIRSGQPFDIVITDQMMPQLTGLELARTIAERLPGTKVLLCSGRDENIDHNEVAAARVAGFVLKPFDLIELADRIETLLAATVAVGRDESRDTGVSRLWPSDRGADRPSGTPDVFGVESGRVLVIDDDATVRVGLQMVLEDAGYEAVVVASGEEALELGAAQGWRFDAIVADHRLRGGLSGTATAKEMHARAGRRCPTLVITGDTAPERIAEVSISGFEMMHKPVQPDEILRKLARMLREGVATSRFDG
jgi:CheY-like chemotaxis protein